MIKLIKTQLFSRKFRQPTYVIRFTTEQELAAARNMQLTISQLLNQQDQGINTGLPFLLDEGSRLEVDPERKLVMSVSFRDLGIATSIAQQIRGRVAWVEAENTGDMGKRFITRSPEVGF